METFECGLVVNGFMTGEAVRSLLCFYKGETRKLQTELKIMVGRGLDRMHPKTMCPSQTQQGLPPYPVAH